MKRILALVALLIAASPLASGQATQGGSGQATSSGQQGDEQELTRLEHEWSQALVKRDKSVLDRLFADDYTTTDPEGNTFTKAQDIANITGGDLTFESAVLDNVKVRVYGDMAVVTGRTTSKGKYKGQDISGQYQFTDVFVKQGGRWRAVTSQATRIAPQQRQGQATQATPQPPTEKKP